MTRTRCRPERAARACDADAPSLRRRAQVRLASIAENSFNAVERIDEFCSLPQEAPAKLPGAKPDGWPPAGKVAPTPQPRAAQFWISSQSGILAGLERAGRLCCLLYVSMHAC
jgi:hypothetical protein